MIDRPILREDDIVDMLVGTFAVPDVAHVGAVLDDGEQVQALLMGGGALDDDVLARLTVLDVPTNHFSLPSIQGVWCLSNEAFCRPFAILH